MGTHYIVKDYDQLEEGEMILAYGRHVLGWNFETMGEPAYGIVPVECDTDALKAENARLRAAARWIPVGERLPDDNLSVLIYIEEDNAILEAVYAHGIFWETSDFGLEGVTHWRPLPDPPEVQ